MLIKDFFAKSSLLAKRQIQSKTCDRWMIRLRSGVLGVLSSIRKRLVLSYSREEEYGLEDLASTQQPEVDRTV